MKQARDVVILICSLLLVSIISACGGGGSGSGAGGGGAFVGTYSGPFTITVSAPGTGAMPVTAQGNTTVVVNPDGTVIVDPGPNQFTGTISGNKFTASFPASDLNEPGFTCSGTINMTGTGSGNAFEGTVSGSATCNGIPMTVSGSFKASRISKSSIEKVTLGGELGEAFRRLVVH